MAGKRRLAAMTTEEKAFVAWRTKRHAEWLLDEKEFPEMEEVFMAGYRCCLAHRRFRMDIRRGGRKGDAVSDRLTDAELSELEKLSDSWEAEAMKRTKIAPRYLTGEPRSRILSVLKVDNIDAGIRKVRALLAVERAARKTACEPGPFGTKHDPKCITCAALARLDEASKEGRR